MERSPNHAPIVGYVKSGISRAGIILTLAEPDSSRPLSAKDLWLFGFPSFTDFDALPTSPPIAFSLAAWCECYRYFHQITNIIFFGTPQRFHDLQILPYHLMDSLQGGRETAIHRIASPATPIYLADRNDQRDNPAMNRRAVF